MPNLHTNTIPQRYIFDSVSLEFRQETIRAEFANKKENVNTLYKKIKRSNNINHCSDKAGFCSHF